MTPKQYARAIEKLGLSQVKAGEFLGFTGRQSRRWIAGDRDIPKAVAMLLALMVVKDIPTDEAERLAD